MKKAITLLLVSAFLFSATTQLNAQTLVASYPFNGNANDASGNGNNGTVNGASLTTDRFGNTGNAYLFDGVSSFIEVPNSVSLQLSNSYTLAAWVKPNGFYSGPCQANFILAKGPQISEGHYNLQYGDFLDGNCGTYTPSNENFASTIRKGASEQSVYENPNTLPVALNNWYYVVCTYDGTTQKLFVNGKLRATNITTGSFGALNTQNLFIGKVNDASGYFVNGVIDDIRIFNGVLTDAAIFDDYVNDLKKAGSGNTLLFDGVDDYVNIGQGWNPSGAFTFECWFKKSEVAANNLVGDLLVVSNQVNGLAIGLWVNNTIVVSKVGVGGAFSATAVNDTKWHHLAVTFNGTDQWLVYIDGVPDPVLTFNPGGFNAVGDYYIGGRNQPPPSGGFFKGNIEEWRFWNGVVLTQTQIRDGMCRKVSSAHPQYANLKGYFRFDEGIASKTGGFNGNFGDLVNSPSWQVSGAAIGDASAHDYVNATKSASLTAGTGERLTVTSSSGNPSGVQVYLVAEKPNTLNGTSGIGANNKYFGVFQAGGTSPQYTAEYNYNGNPYVNPGNESQLRLNKRDDNAATTWSVLPELPNEPANTITVTGQSTEYILGTIGSPLPVTLLSFAASQCSNNVCLLWTIENEADFSHYELERGNSDNRFSRIYTAVSSNSGSRKNYSFTDLNPVMGDNYYRLKMVNQDGSFTYSRIIRINFGAPEFVSLQPNPASTWVLIKGTDGYQQLRIIDLAGHIQLQKSIRSGVEAVDIGKLLPGMYFVQLVKENGVTTLKLVKN